MADQMQDVGPRYVMLMLTVSGMFCITIMQTIAFLSGRDGQYFQIVLGAIMALATGTGGMSAWMAYKDRRAE